MSEDIEEFWAAIPPKALHPLRVPILEAFRWIGEPLSAIMLVDVLDGAVAMAEASAHLDALAGLGVTERAERNPQARHPRDDHYDVPYRLNPRIRALLPPQYNRRVVEHVLFEELAELHPDRIRADKVLSTIVGNPDDAREVEIAKLAIQGLREFGLITPDPDRPVGLTPAALHAHMLLVRWAEL